MLNERRIQVCVQCRARSPEVDGLTLISARHGWRLLRKTEPDGTSRMEWRCPTCADKFKRLRALSGQSSGFHPAVKDPKKDG